MAYKTISRLVTKEELRRKMIVMEEFILRKEPKNLKLIQGKIENNNNEKIKNCAVVLQYRKKYMEEYKDLKIAYTNNEGLYGFVVNIDKDKEYRIVVFSPNNIK